MTSHHEQQIVGFDAREMWQVFQSAWPWPTDRKESMLIQQEIIKPLSTEKYVWPSVFDTLDLVENGKFKLFYRDSRLKRPDWIGALDLWQDLQILRDHLDSGWGDKWEPCWLIAVTVLPQTFSTQKQAYWGGRLVATIPSSLDEQWQFLGFDVSDGHLLSGLMGCGHPDSDKKFIPYLNENHLFTDLDQALSFKEEMNVGNHQHAPFFVYGLHLVRDSAYGKNWRGESFLIVVDDNP